MRVLFLQDVPGTADAGDVREVKNGFARNYLIPNKLAAPATVSQLQRIANTKKAAEGRRQQEARKIRVIAEKLVDVTILVERKVGPTGKLYGAVSSRHIAEKATELMGHEVDHRAVLIEQPIHELGDYPVKFRLHRDVTIDATVSVVVEGGQSQVVKEIDGTNGKKSGLKEAVENVTVPNDESSDVSAQGDLPTTEVGVMEIEDGEGMNSTVEEVSETSGEQEN